MAWIFTIAFFAFLYWRARRARERVAEYQATGMLRSPLYWASNILLLMLLRLMLSAGHIQHQGRTLAMLWLGGAVCGCCGATIRAPRIEMALSDLAAD